MSEFFLFLWLIALLAIVYLFSIKDKTVLLKIAINTLTLIYTLVSVYIVLGWLKNALEYILSDMSNIRTVDLLSFFIFINGLILTIRLISVKGDFLGLIKKLDFLAYTVLFTPFLTVTPLFLESISIKVEKSLISTLMLVYFLSVCTITLTYNHLGKIINYINDGLFWIINRIRLKLDTPNSPEFIQENLFPWETQYILTSGKVDQEDIILSYLFYLAYRKFLYIGTDGEKLIFKVYGKNFPNLLGEEIDAIILQQYSDSEVLLATLKANFHLFENSISNSLSKYYILESNHKKGVFIWFTSLVGFMLIFCIILIIGPLISSYIEVFNGQLYSDLSVYSWVFYTGIVSIGAFLDLILAFIIVPVINQIVILNGFGSELKINALAYKAYVSKVEKPKLNFEHQIQSLKIQHYLPHLSYAVAFGFIKEYSLLFDKLVKKRNLK